MIIAFVGIDGVGKTTLINMFEKYLKKEGKKVHIIKALNLDSDFMKNYNILRNQYFLKYPDKKHTFNVISSYLMSFDLFQQSEVIKKMDSQDTVVLLDRWAICQHLYAKVWMANNEFTDLAYNSCLEPKLTFVIDADMELVQKRIEDRGGANEFENILSLRRLKKLYQNYAKNNEKTIYIKNNAEIEIPYLEIINEYNKVNLNNK